MDEDRRISACACSATRPGRCATVTGIPIPATRMRPDPMDQDGFVHVSQRPGLGDDVNFGYINGNLL